MRRKLRRIYMLVSRSLDKSDIDVILARDFGEEGLGLAILDRLRRASSRLVKVESGE